MSRIEKATVGGGCFWCIEAAFQRVEGVEKVTSGYSGGEVENPTYDQVCSGATDHAEVVQITYDSDSVSYFDLLTIFFTVHDPTQLNRQGPDVGSHYRSIILYRDERQKRISENMIESLNDSNQYDGPIVTEVKPFEVFYPAEDHHQDYFKKNPNQAYCRLMIPPKLEKLERKHDELIGRTSLN